MMSRHCVPMAFTAMSVRIAYTKQKKNRGTMTLRGVGYSAYTLRYGSYCTYEIAPSSQSSLTLYGRLCDVCLGWYLRPIVFHPMLRS